MGYWIVVVDDDVIELKNAKNLLEDQGIRVSCLRSGTDLLKFMENNTPDLVLMDILMPDMDGFEAFHALRELEEAKGRSATPVIFLSGDRDRETERRSLKDGASDFIRKPFDREIMLSRIANTIENNKTIAILKEKADIDRLTGFLNKTSGTERIKDMCAHDTGALMLFDIDNFKLINDIYGHDMGDRVLVAFSEIVRHNTRSEDIISRIGGDEFLGFFSGLTSTIAVMALTDRLNDQLQSKCVDLMGREFDVPIGISVGVASVPVHSRNYSVLFRCADSAMYRVKQNGKHGVQIYDAELSDEDNDNKNGLDDDMARISKILNERTAEGAMVLGKDTFIHTYRFALRFLKRYRKGAEKILFSLSTADPDTSVSELTPQLIDILQKKLRKSDVIVQIKSDEILVFLPVITSEEADMVVNRIVDAFAGSCNESINLDYVSDHIAFD